MNKNQITENSYVMNTKTGKAYKVTTSTVQSRNRRELVGTGIRNPEITQVAESHLHPLSFPAAYIVLYVLWRADYVGTTVFRFFVFRKVTDCNRL